MNYKQFIQSLTRPQLLALLSQVGRKHSISWLEKDTNLRANLIGSHSPFAAEGKRIFKEVYGG